MDPDALVKSCSRIRIAKNAVEKLVECQDYETFVDLWYTFLVATKNIYTALEQGAKVSAQSRQWFGAKKTIRRNDELLQYLFQARNDDEHGLRQITEHVPGRLVIGASEPGYSSDMVFNGTIGRGGNLSITSLDGKPVLSKITLPHPRLIRVHGRDKRPYDPPTMHLGVAIDGDQPIPVAVAAVAYFESLIEEAKGLA